MNNKIIKSFDFNDKHLTVYGTIDKPLFKAKEVAKMLGYIDTDQSIRKNVADEFKVKISVCQTGRYEVYLYEPGIYALVSHSKLPEAKRFQKWIFSEVLPSIRKTGEYSMKKPNAYITLSSQFILNNEKEYRIKLITYLRFRRETDIKHLIFTGSMGELLKGDGYDIRRDAIMLGYEKGSADIIISTPSGKFLGCYIEIKYGDNELTEEQKYSINQYKLNGYKIIVSNEWTDLQRKVDDYLRDIRIPCEFCKCKFKSNNTLKNHLIYFHRHSN